jgi:hypothetical protein
MQPLTSLDRHTLVSRVSRVISIVKALHDGNVSFVNACDGRSSASS